MNRCRKKSKNLWQHKLHHARQRISPSLNLRMKNSIESSAFSSWRVSRATPSSSSPVRRRKMHPCSILSMSVSSATLRKSLSSRPRHLHRISTAVGQRSNLLSPRIARRSRNRRRVPKSRNILLNPPEKPFRSAMPRRLCPRRTSTQFWPRRYRAA